MSNEAVGGLTIESVNAMQDEMNKIEDPDEVAAAAEAKAAEDAKLAEAKAAEDAKAAEEAAKKAEADSKAKDGEIDVVRELKEQIRASNEALKKVTGDYAKLQKIMVDKGVITEDEVKASEAEEQARLNAFTERQNKLTEMVTIMELNPTYTDVREVCSQGNLDDIVEAFSKYYAKENGGVVADIAKQMEAEIWQEPNPYKKIYELVKKYHPRYAKADDDAAAKQKAADDEAAKVKAAEEAAKKIAEEADKKKAIEANPSAANIGAGGAGGSGAGWTAAKIDALPEDELKTVPKELYEKYLAGTLA